MPLALIARKLSDESYVGVQILKEYTNQDLAVELCLIFFYSVQQ